MGSHSSSPTVGRIPPLARLALQDLLSSPHTLPRGPTLWQLSRASALFISSGARLCVCPVSVHPSCLSTCLSCLCVSIQSVHPSYLCLCIRPVCLSVCASLSLCPVSVPVLSVCSPYLCLCVRPLSVCLSCLCTPVLSLCPPCLSCLSST